MPSEIEISSLMDSLSRWEIAGYCSTAAVVLGCAGESIHELTSWFRGVTWWRLHGGKISAWLLIAALAIEVPIQLKTNQISGHIIGRMNLKTAELNTRTAQSELELEHLRQSTTPRLLTLARNNFGEILKGKPTGSFKIWYVTENEDALNLAQFLAGYLSTAGWKGTTPTPIPPLPPVTGDDDTLFMRASGGMTGGNGIVLRCSKLSKWREESSPIGSLEKCFEKAGVQVGIVPEEMFEIFKLPLDAVSHSLAKDEVLIVVGTRY